MIMAYARMSGVVERIEKDGHFFYKCTMRTKGRVVHIYGWSFLDAFERAIKSMYILD